VNQDKSTIKNKKTTRKPQENHKKTARKPQENHRKLKSIKY
jgi:hypothetical protein